MSEGIANAEFPEIETTPEMIEAGLSGLYGFSPWRLELTAEETVEAIYCSMERARLRERRDGGYVGKGGGVMRRPTRTTKVSHNIRVTSR